LGLSNVRVVFGILRIGLKFGNVVDVSLNFIRRNVFGFGNFPFTLLPFVVVVPAIEIIPLILFFIELFLDRLIDAQYKLLPQVH
jgi:hypothetical protein